jgi:hypothetical protein
VAPPIFSRRAVLLGSASAAVLAACGGKSGSATTTSSATTAPSTAGTFSLVQLFDPNNLLVTGSAQRAPFAVGDPNGVIVKDPPASLTFTVASSDGTVVGAPIEVARHDKDLPRAYYPLVFTPPDAGTYTAATEIGGKPVQASFAVQIPDKVPVPRAAQPMPTLPTPTTADHRGVNPICTRDPACPFHTVSLDAALQPGGPVAFIVSTPKYCQVAICGPVLDVLMGLQAAYPAVTMIHAEVWSDDTTTTPAPAVQALNLTYEPVLFLVGAGGSIEQRLDTIFDTDETNAGLQALTG